MSEFKVDDVARIALANSDAARELADQITVLFGVLHAVVAELDAADPGARERIVGRAANALAGRSDRITELSAVVIAGLWTEPEIPRPPALN